jgi:hypothetical protein
VKALAALALLPTLAEAQAAQVRISPVEDVGGTVVGRVCEDRDGDGRCSEDEPGVAGARVILEGGQVAQTDSDGRFHFLEVPARLLLPGRAAYGGHVVAVEGAPGEPRVRRHFELAPGGTARVDLALPPAAVAAPPRLEPPIRSRPAGGRRNGQALAWILSGSVAPGSAVEVNGAPARVDDSGIWSAEVALEPRENGFGVVVVEPGGRLALYHLVVHLVPRRDGGDLVVPRAPELLAAVGLPPPGQAAKGLALTLRGTVSPGVSLKVGEAEVRPGPAGAFQTRAAIPPGESALSFEARRGTERVATIGKLRFEREGGAVAGLADLELSVGSKALLTGRAALSARGVWKGIEGEAGIDVDDRDRQLAALLHPRDPGALEHQLSVERSFPTVGDEAVADDANAARGRIHARLSAPGFDLRAGAARPGMTGQELGRYDRALFGLKVSGEGGAGPLRLEGSVFGASPRADPGQVAPPRPAHDELSATGGSLFYLRRGDVVAGTEALRLEWRDPLTGLAVDQRALRRGIDYEIDYPSGRILLARPLPTAGGPPALATGDPFLAPRAVLLADYSFAADWGRDDAFGAKGAAAAGPLRLEAGVAGEDRSVGAYRLGTAGARLAIAPQLSVDLQLARSEGAAFAGPAPGFSRSLDGGISFAAPVAPGSGANALHVAARGEAPGASYEAWWRERQKGFSDSSHLEALDARERGARAAWAGGGLELSGLYAERRGADPRDPAGMAPADDREIRARASYGLGEVRLTAEALESRVETPESRGEQASAGLRADWRLHPWLSLDASHHQSLWREGTGPAAEASTFSAVGAQMTLPEGALGVRGGWGPDLGPRVLFSGERTGEGETTYATFHLDPDAPDALRESVSAMGARQRQGGAELFTEEQFGRDPFGVRASRVAGASVEVARGVRLTASAETGKRLRLDGTEVARGAGGAGASLLVGPVRLALRGEMRKEGDDRQAFAGAAAEWRASPSLVVSGRGSWARTLAAAGDALLASAVLGCAWRGEGLSLLGKVAAIAEQRPGSARRDTGLASLAGAIDLTRQIVLGLGAHLGLTRLLGGKEDLASGSARVGWRVGGPVDASFEYARRQALAGAQPDEVHAARLEAGWALGEGRVALGYNLFGFAGTGVDPADEARGRVYLRAELVY